MFSLKTQNSTDNEPDFYSALELITLTYPRKSLNWVVLVLVTVSILPIIVSGIQQALVNE